MLGQVGGRDEGALDAPRCALRGESALKGEALRGRSLPGAEPGKEGGGVCARPWLPEAAVFGSGGGGWGAPGQISAFRPEEERLGPKKVTQAPLGTLGAPGPSGSPRPPRVSWFPGDAGPRWAGLLGRGGWAPGRSERDPGLVMPGTWPALCPALHPHLRAPLFLIKFKLELHGALPTRCPLLSPPPPSIPHRLASSLFLCLFPTT